MGVRTIDALDPWWRGETLGLGIAFTTESIAAMVVEHRRASSMVQWGSAEHTPEKLFHGMPNESTTQYLVGAIQRLCHALKERYVVAQIAIPDAATRRTIFSLESLPRNRKAREALIRWRLAREHEIEITNFSCSWQLCGTDAQKQPIIMAVIADSAWVKCIAEVCRQAQLPVQVIDTTLSYQFNHLYNTVEKGPGALLSVTSEGHALAIWDSTRRLRQVRAWQRDLHTTADSEEVAADVEHTLRTYVRGGGIAPTKLYVHGALADVTRLEERLHARCFTGVIKRPLYEGLNLSAEYVEPRCGDLAAAVSAAFPR